MAGSERSRRAQGHTSRVATARRLPGSPGPPPPGAPGVSKVTELHLPVCCQQDVGALDVPVPHPRVPEVLQRPQQLPEDAPDLVPAQLPVLPEEVTLVGDLEHEVQVDGRGDELTCGTRRSGGAWPVGRTRS